MHKNSKDLTGQRFGRLVALKPTEKRKGKNIVWRCKESRELDIHNEFPLATAKMTRKDCKQFILDHHLEVPIRSGCWFCPFQRNEQWRRLKRTHPDLYEKAKTLEQANMVRRAKQGKLPLTLSANRKRLEVITMEGQMELFD